jgi:hypothetical protein
MFGCATEITTQTALKISQGRAGNDFDPSVGFACP